MNTLVSIIILIISVVTIFLILNDDYRALFLIIGIYPFFVGIKKSITITEGLFSLSFFLLISFSIFRIKYKKYLLSLKEYLSLIKAVIILGLIVFASSIWGFINGSSMIDIFKDGSRFLGYFLIIPAIVYLRNKKRVLTLWKILISIGFPMWVLGIFLWIARRYKFEFATLPILAGGEYFKPFLKALWPMLLLVPNTRIKSFCFIGIILTTVYYLVSSYRHLVLDIFLTNFMFLGLVFFYHHKVRKLNYILILVVILFPIILFFIIMSGKLAIPHYEKLIGLYSSIANVSNLEKDLSFQGRILESKIALKEFFYPSPLIGSGMGRWLNFYLFGLFEKNRLWLHLWPVEILSKIGILGTFSVIWFLFLIMKVIIKNIRTITNPYYKSVSIGFLFYFIISLIPALGSILDRGFVFVVSLMTISIIVLGRDS